MPKRISPRSARSRKAGLRIQKMLDLRAGEIGIQHQAGLLAEKRLAARRPSAVRRSAALTRLCQTTALATGLPVWRSQRMVVSRWLVMPSAAMSSAESDASAIARRATSNCEDQIASGSCSTTPGRGRICGNSCWAVAKTRPSREKTIARLDVVPWSRARMQEDMINPPLSLWERGWG